MEPDVPPVVLLCGGLGLRQRSEGDDLPKPLRPLPDGRSLLLHVMDRYRAFGAREFVLCVGYGARAIEARVAGEFQPDGGRVDSGPGWRRRAAGGLILTFVDSGPAAEKCARLLDARTHLGGREFLLGYADVLSDFDLGRLVDRHRAAGGVLTVVATRVRSRYGELTVDPRLAVTGFREKPLGTALISAGYFMCAPELFDHLGPDLLFEADVLPRLAASGRMHACVHDGVWLPFDTYKDFVDVEAAARDGLPWLART